MSQARELGHEEPGEAVPRAQEGGSGRPRTSARRGTTRRTWAKARLSAISTSSAMTSSSGVDLDEEQGLPVARPGHPHLDRGPRRDGPRVGAFVDQLAAAWSRSGSGAGAGPRAPRPDTGPRLEIRASRSAGPVAGQVAAEDGEIGQPLLGAELGQRRQRQTGQAGHQFPVDRVGQVGHGVVVGVDPVGAVDGPLPPRSSPWAGSSRWRGWRRSPRPRRGRDR